MERLPLTGGEVPHRSGANVDDDPGRCDHRELEHIPVGEMNAALRFGAADLRRLRRSVYTVVRLGQSHPEHADGVIGTRRNIGFHVMWLGVVNERRIVGEYRIPDFGSDLELAYRDRVPGAAGADRKLRKPPTRAIDSLQSPIGLEKDDPARLAWIRFRCDVRH